MPVYFRDDVRGDKLESMSYMPRKDKFLLETYVPGVVKAYQKLRAHNSMGIYTSNGEMYNHTLFGRDAAMSAQFVVDFDPEAAHETIAALIATQGVGYNKTTQEEPGRILHELRDMRTWVGRPVDRLFYTMAGWVWGMKNHEFLIYFAADSTAHFVRLVKRYAMHVDAQILDETMTNKIGQKVLVRDALAAAANWIVSHVDATGLMAVPRTNEFSHPYGSFEDSVSSYAWSDKTAANFKRPFSFVEAQAFSLTSLRDACFLLDSHPQTDEWRRVADMMQRTLLDRFWVDDWDYFSSMVCERGGQEVCLDVPNISAAWILNTTFWNHVHQRERQDKVRGIVERVFSEDFLTPVGLRTRSLNYPEPLGSVIDYHGSQTVWPMFTFMVIEGLHRHHMHRLARQLENRLINASNALPGFFEYYIVDHDNIVFEPIAHTAFPSRSIQFYPEREIAFTVVPMMVMAHRAQWEIDGLKKETWQHKFEDEILARIPYVPRHNPENARAHIQPKPVTLSRRFATLRSAEYILRQELLLPGEYETEKKGSNHVRNER